MDDVMLYLHSVRVAGHVGAQGGGPNPVLNMNC